MLIIVDVEGCWKERAVAVLQQSEEPARRN